MNTAPETDYYISRKGKLLKEFDHVVGRVKKILVRRYGEAFTAQVVKETRMEYESLIPKLPYIGGKKNPLTFNLVSSAWFLALYHILKAHGKPIDEIGQVSYELYDAYFDAFPKFILRLMGMWRFTKLYLRKMDRSARESQKKTYPGDFVYTMLKGDGKGFDWGVDYVECAICKFYKEQGAEEFLPYLCPLDAVMSERTGLGLTRTKTLAEGFNKCDFRFKKGGETRVNKPWIKN